MGYVSAQLLLRLVLVAAVMHGGVQAETLHVGGQPVGVARTSANDPRVLGEIVALLDVVENCGCAFMRNGSWYSATDARKILEHKLNDVLRTVGGVTSAEHFIEKSASRSSMSGKPYLVRCAEEKAVESGAWLMDKLVELRSAGKPPHTPAR